MSREITIEFHEDRDLNKKAENVWTELDLFFRHNHPEYRLRLHSDKIKVLEIIKGHLALTYLHGGLDEMKYSKGAD